MHHHFNLKSLAFYGVAIGSVLLLFKVVTAYGESNLKAPPTINSQYRLVFNDIVPTCEKSDATILNIQQSGIYLNGFIQPANPNAKSSSANATSSLSGRLNNQQLSLSGKVPTAILCNTVGSSTQTNTSQQNNSWSSVKIQIQLLDKQDLIGTISVNGTPKAIGLRAIPQKANEKTEQSNMH